MNPKTNAIIAMLETLSGHTIPAAPAAKTLPEWKRKSRDNKPIKRPADKLVQNQHFASVYTRKVNFKRPKIVTKGRTPSDSVELGGGFRAILGNHDRVVRLRRERDPQYLR